MSFFLVRCRGYEEQLSGHAITAGPACEFFQDMESRV